MNTEPNLPQLKLPTVHEAGDATEWIVRIEGENDPLMLPRLLQKIAVPDIGLSQVKYETTPQGSITELRLFCARARLRLTLSKWEKLPVVRTMSLEGHHDRSP